MFGIGARVVMARKQAVIPYIMTSSADALSEGGAFTVTVSTVPGAPIPANGTRLYYKIAGNDMGSYPTQYAGYLPGGSTGRWTFCSPYDFAERPDFQGGSGYFTLNNGTGSITLNSLIDQTTLSTVAQKQYTSSLINYPSVSKTVQINDTPQAAGYKFTPTATSCPTATGRPGDYSSTAHGQVIWCSGSTYSSGWVGTTFTGGDSGYAHIRWWADDLSTIYINGRKLSSSYQGGWSHFTAILPTGWGATYYVSANIADTGGAKGFCMDIRNGINGSAPLIKKSSTSGWVRT